jgi:hypothetical protein
MGNVLNLARAHRDCTPAEVEILAAITGSTVIKDAKVGPDLGVDDDGQPIHGDYTYENERLQYCAVPAKVFARDAARLKAAAAAAAPKAPKP